MKKKIIAGTIAGSLLMSGNTLAASHTVKSGDTLWKISNNYNVSVSQLKKWNNISSNIIYPGQVLRINSSSTGNNNSMIGSNNSMTGSNNPTNGSSTTSTYTVVKGDTFSKIAKKLNLTTAKLQALNPSITNINVLKIGQVLTVSRSTQSNSSSGNSTNSNNTSTSTSTYTVQSGDTFSKIATKFGMSQSSLLKLNPQIKNVNILRVGQVINLSSKLSGNSSTTITTTADAIINTGNKYLGTPYLYGSSPNTTSTFDCSSYTQHVFKENGITLPRTSGAQSKIGKSVSLSNIRKGDLIFFDTDYNGDINHVGIAMSSTTMIHCQNLVGVSVSSLNTYWKPRVVKVTRLL